MRLREFKGPEKKGINWDRIIKDNPILKDILKKITPGTVAKILNPNKVMQLITTIFSSGQLNKGEQAELDRIKDLAKSYADLEDAFGTEVAPKTLPKRSKTKIEPGDTPLPQRQAEPKPGKIDVPEPVIPKVEPQPLIKPGLLPKRSKTKIEPGDTPLPQRQTTPTPTPGKIDVPEPVIPKVEPQPLIKPGLLPKRSKTKIDPGTNAPPVRSQTKTSQSTTIKAPTVPIPKTGEPSIRNRNRNRNKLTPVLTPVGDTDTGVDLYGWMANRGSYYDWDKPGVPLKEQQSYTKEQYADLVRKYSKQYGVPESLALHVLNRETGIYDPNKAATIKSRAGAVGPMQLLPRYAKDFGIKKRDLTNPVKNIEAGVRYLAKNYNRFSENPQHALMAYNWGPTATANWLAKGGKGNIPQETRDYIYGSEEKGWAPYNDDFTQQINAYLGTNAQSYLEKQTLAPQLDTRKLDPQQMATGAAQGFDTIAQTAQDYAKKGYDYVAPIAKDLGKAAGTIGKEVYKKDIEPVFKKTSDYLNKKWQDFKTDAMATSAGTDTATIAGAGDTGELPDVIEPRSPAPRPQTQGGPIRDKAKESAPPGDKYERMVKDIKKGYTKDGKLTDTERGIAYATAWNLYNKRKGKKS